MVFVSCGQRYGMKEQIRKALQGIEELEEKETWRRILEEVFLNLYDYTKEQIQTIETQLVQELGTDTFSYDIYTSLVKRDQYDKADNFLYPMRQCDLEKVDYDLNKIKKALQKQECYYLYQVFFQCDTLIFNKIVDNTMIWNGCIITDQGSYQAKFEIKREMSYIAQIESLYKEFVRNTIPWNPVFAPYIQKIASVYLASCEGDLTQSNEIKEVILDFGQYASYVKEEMIPLWNVQEIKVKTRGFAYPIDDTKLYEHKMSLREQGTQHSYLIIDNTRNFAWNHVRRYSDYITAFCETDESLAWRLKKIGFCVKVHNRNYSYMTNRKKNSFLTAYAEHAMHPIYTEAEINRIVQIFEAFDRMQLIDYYLTEHEQGESYILEPFYQDEIRDESKKMKMIFRFVIDQKDYLARDRLSFFIAQIQHYFPEYKCVGILL